MGPTPTSRSVSTQTWPTSTPNLLNTQLTQTMFILTQTHTCILIYTHTHSVHTHTCNHSPQTNTHMQMLTNAYTHNAHTQTYTHLPSGALTLLPSREDGDGSQQDHRGHLCFVLGTGCRWKQGKTHPGALNQRGYGSFKVNKGGGEEPPRQLRTFALKHQEVSVFPHPHLFPTVLQPS